MTRVIRHSVRELRDGLRRIDDRQCLTPIPGDDVREELAAAGLVRQVDDGSIALTPAGRRFLRTGR